MDEPVNSSMRHKKITGLEEETSEGNAQ